MRTLRFPIASITFILVHLFSYSLSLNLKQNNQIIQSVINDDILTLKYEPDWKSLDKRPLPGWYDNSKIGIFIHWGVFSVPAFRGAWFWYDWKKVHSPDVTQFMSQNYPPNFTYQDFAYQFKTQFYNATEWVELFKKAGARYVVLTSKHHEGYTLWPSKYSFSWNAHDVGPQRDLVGELAEAIRENTDIKFGLYHSLYEWFNPLYISDTQTNQTQDFVNFKTLPELYELVNTYLPEIIWSDGDWEKTDNYWKSKEFLSWLYNESPVKDNVVTNDRWGKGTMCKHGGYYTCQDRFNPKVLQKHKWENCYTLDKYAWGHRTNAKLDDYNTAKELVQTLVETVACGGNFLINIGPTKEGIIPVIQQERLVEMGEWLEVNGDAIYETIPWTVQNDSVTSSVWYTSRPNRNRVYAISVTWPGEKLKLGSISSYDVKGISILGSEEVIKWSKLYPIGIQIYMPPMSTSKSKWSWVAVINF